MNINEKVIRNLHTVEPRAPGVGLDTRWMPSRPIRIAILDSGYDPNSQFFKDQEDFGNYGIKTRITWKDFIGDGPPEDKHEERHGTKLLCLMLMMLPMAEIFVGRVALNKTYTESTKFVGPLVEVSRCFLKAFANLPNNVALIAVADRACHRQLTSLQRFGVSMLSPSPWASMYRLNRDWRGQSNEPVNTEMTGYCSLPLPETKVEARMRGTQRIIPTT